MSTNDLRLSVRQFRLLRAIKVMEDMQPLEGAHDAEGDLSLCSRNLTASLVALRRQGLVAGWACHEPDYYYSEVKLTPRGRWIAS